MWEGQGAGGGGPGGGPNYGQLATDLILLQRLLRKLEDRVADIASREAGPNGWTKPGRALFELLAAIGLTPENFPVMNLVLDAAMDLLSDDAIQQGRRSPPPTPLVSPISPSTLYLAVQKSQIDCLPWKVQYGVIQSLRLTSAEEVRFMLPKEVPGLCLLPFNFHSYFIGFLEHHRHTRGTQQDSCLDPLKTSSGRSAIKVDGWTQGRVCTTIQSSKG